MHSNRSQLQQVILVSLSLNCTSVCFKGTFHPNYKGTLSPADFLPLVLPAQNTEVKGSLFVVQKHLKNSQKHLPIAIIYALCQTLSMHAGEEQRAQHTLNKDVKQV